jgi:hypothetical protein
MIWIFSTRFYHNSYCKKFHTCIISSGDDGIVMICGHQDHYELYLQGNMYFFNVIRANE